MPNKNRFASSYVIHASKSGVFKGLRLHPEIQGRVIKQSLFVQEGEQVHAFRNGGDSIGAMVIAFDNVEQMDDMMDKMWDYVEVLVE